MIAARVAIASLVILSACGQRRGVERSYVICPTASMCRVLKFDKPASFDARILEDQDSELLQLLGKPLCASTFSDLEASEYSYSLFVFPLGRAFGEERPVFEQKLIEAQSENVRNGLEGSDLGIFETCGRKVFHFVLGFGPGGEATGILFRHSTEPIEVVVVQGIAYRKPPYPKDRKPDARPTIRYQDAICEIEKLIEIQ